jgi:hypothetical protein
MLAPSFAQRTIINLLLSFVGIKRINEDVRTHFFNPNNPRPPFVRKKTNHQKPTQESGRSPPQIRSQRKTKLDSIHPQHHYTTRLLTNSLALLLAFTFFGCIEDNITVGEIFQEQTSLGAYPKLISVETEFLTLPT